MTLRDDDDAILLFLSAGGAATLGQKLELHCLGFEK
jgi:hypothetical protein